MSTLTNEDLGFVVARIPKDLRTAMIEHDLIVAGGFIRETIADGDVKDIDVFGPSYAALDAAARVPKMSAMRLIRQLLRRAFGWTAARALYCLAMPTLLLACVLGCASDEIDEWSRRPVRRTRKSL